MTKILCTIFFFSGVSALIFEALWFQLSGLTLGNSVLATSIVLTSFMGGLALGNGLTAFRGHKIRSPIRFYAYLEIVIAISGFGLVLIFPILTELLVPAFRLLFDHPLLLNLVRLVVAVILMLIPSTAMGATLPILVKALYAESPNFGRVLGRLYGWNTLGAVAGVIICELYLIRWLGIRETGLVAAGFNLFAAAMAFRLSGKTVKRAADPGQGEKRSGDTRFSFQAYRLLSAGFLSGFALLALEVVWFRFLLLFFTAHSLNFAVMLAMVLAGISLGGLFCSLWYQRRSEAHRFLIPVVFLNGILALLIYRYFGILFKSLAAYPDEIRILLASLFLIFPVSFISGIMFTLLGRSLHLEIKAETQTTGWLTLANTIGGMIGPPAAGFLLIPLMGIEKSFFIVALVYGLIAALLFDKKQLNPRPWKNGLHYLAPAVFIAALFLFPFGRMVEDYLAIPCLNYMSKGERRVAVKEGLTETVQYLQKDFLGAPYYHRLVTDNYSMSATDLYAKRYMKLYVYLPVALQSNPKNALLICFGCGSTAKALTDTKSLERIDIVDTSRNIVEMSRVIYPAPGENPVHDPRTRIHIEDGRFFLLSAKRTYDLITAEPPPPKHAGIVNLYSQEYFQLIYDRLSEGGIATYWLPVYQLEIGESRSILKGFANVFKNCTLWTGSGYEWMMVGVKNPKKAVSEKEFIRQWHDPAVKPEMRYLGFDSPEQLGSLFIADGRRLRAWLGDSQPLRDNYPRRLSYRYSGWAKAVPVYRNLMAPGASAENFMRSGNISKIWPHALRKKAAAYFPVRRTVNALLTRMDQEIGTPLTNLQRCLSQPLLENYMLWAFGSDHAAQRILASKFGNQPEINPSRKMADRVLFYRHSAAAAAQRHDYPLADDYLRRVMEVLGPGRIDRSYYEFRMYLLCIAGHEGKARTVAREYIEQGREFAASGKEAGRVKRKKIMEMTWARLENFLFKWGTAVNK